MAHKKYEVFRQCIDELQGKRPPPGWAESTIKRLVAAGATPEDLREISEQIKRGFGKANAV